MIIIYLTSIIIANLTVAHFGPKMAIINAFIFIALDLTLRDALHEKWRGDHLTLKMITLIFTGSLLSFILNKNALNIAVASFVAFLIGSIIDTVVYHLLKNKKYLIKINGSNIPSAMTDSVIFPILAFGWPPLYFVIIGQMLAKIIGGFLWSIVLNRVKHDK